MRMASVQLVVPVASSRLHCCVEDTVGISLSAEMVFTDVPMWRLSLKSKLEVKNCF